VTPALAWAEPGIEAVAERVYRVPLPLPERGMRAVNCYIVDGDAGITVIDPGWAWEPAFQGLAAALQSLGRTDADIERILVTHHHPDHYPHAVHLRRLTGAPILVGAHEAESIAQLGDPSAPLAPGVRGLLDRAGAGRIARQLDAVARPAGIGEWFERPDGLLLGEEQFAAAEVRIDVVATPGHTSGHLAFVVADSSVIITGDHLLAHITPSIGFETNPRRDALAQFLGSLRLIDRYRDFRALPAHGPSMNEPAVRARELLAHHDQRLAEILQTVQTGAARVLDIAGRLRWTRRGRPFDGLDGRHQMLALIETSVHAAHLADEGMLREDRRGEEIWYSPTNEHRGV